MYNPFPTSLAGLALAEEYRIRLIWRYLRSGNFLSEARQFVVYYVWQAFAICQADLIPSGIHVQFDADSIFGRVTHDSLGWEGDVLEEPEYEWWLGIYEELVHTHASVDPLMLMPLALEEPNEEEGIDTSELMVVLVMLKVSASNEGDVFVPRSMGFSFYMYLNNMSAFLSAFCY